MTLEEVKIMSLFIYLLQDNLKNFKSKKYLTNSIFVKIIFCFKGKSVSSFFLSPSERKNQSIYSFIYLSPSPSKSTHICVALTCCRYLVDCLVDNELRMDVSDNFRNPPIITHVISDYQLFVLVPSSVHSNTKQAELPPVH